MFDTGFGVVLAIAINVLFPRERVVRFLNKLGVHELDELNDTKLNDEKNTVRISN